MRRFTGLRFVVERIHVSGATTHTQEDDTLRLRWRTETFDERFDGLAAIAVSPHKACKARYPKPQEADCNIWRRE